jgi:hypothetical protein
VRLDLDSLRDAFGFGVAGNFAGHLEQAGEAVDFVAVDAAGGAPKGIFPFYAPGSGTFLETFPIAHDRLAKPASDTPVHLQIEPEVGLLCDVVRAADGRVERLAPRALGAFNDCSIRRPNAVKISHKKNWGAASKGLAPTGFAVADLDPEGPTATFRLACFLRRDGATHAYGVDSALPDYSYYGEQLLAWMADRLNAQRGADGTPLEDVGALLADAGAPATVLAGIGATRYTPLGARTFLEVDDEALVVVYDAAATSPAAVEEAVRSGAEGALPAASVLCQRVEAGPAAPALPG